MCFLSIFFHCHILDCYLKKIGFLLLENFAFQLENLLLCFLRGWATGSNSRTNLEGLSQGFSGRGSTQQGRPVAAMLAGPVAGMAPALLLHQNTSSVKQPLPPQRKGVSLTKPAIGAPLHDRQRWWRACTGTFAALGCHGGARGLRR